MVALAYKLSKQSVAAMGMNSRDWSPGIFMAAFIRSVGHSHGNDFIVYLNDFLISAINKLKPTVEKCHGQIQWRLT